MQAAWYYHQIGLRVLPTCRPVAGGGCRHHGKCSSPGKVPLIRWAEFQARAPTGKEVESWWRRTPDANIAIVCGSLFVGSWYITVLDIEQAGLEAVYKTNVPLTPAYRSQGGGLHFWFLSSQALKPRSLAIDNQPVGDLRGYGSLATVPPSVGVRGTYEWLAGAAWGQVPIAVLPEWVLKAQHVESDRYGLKESTIVLPQTEPGAVKLLPQRLQDLYRYSYECLDRSRTDMWLTRELVKLDIADAVIQQVLLFPRGSKAAEKAQVGGDAACLDYIARTIGYARRGG